MFIRLAPNYCEPLEKSTLQLKILDNCPEGKNCKFLLEQDKYNSTTLTKEFIYIFMVIAVSYCVVILMAAWKMGNQSINL